jgi:Flp pilus assembly protein TadD/tRNA A-37 threonylcarbamoyl transferase component Bud32
MPDPAADRNLLFGILALQMDFIGRDALIAAMNAWVLDKAKPLGQVLREQGQLADDEYALLDGLVRKHLEKHGNDPERSLAALNSVGSVRRDLQQVADADVQASLAQVSAARLDDTPPPPATLASTVGEPTGSGLRYSILRPHAKGGLGEVFVARDEELRREVALKEIQEKYADHPESRARFLLEAEITGGLEHPGIVPVYGLGHYGDGRPFYAMRFIRGDSLKDIIQRFHKEKVTFPVGERVLRLRQRLGRFVDVCNAVAYSHARGVLHRDLKPGNIMLGKYGETLVVDWGLAKATGKADVEVTEGLLVPSADSALTQAGKALGTPAYMSPEQAAGRLDQLGPASDLYSLGATLYALLTGRSPFAGGAAGEVLSAVQKGEFPPPRKAEPGVPAALEAVCLKAMALRPRDRYPSAQALAQDVERWLADEPVSAWREPLRVRAGRWVRRHQTAVTATAAATLVALLLGGGGVFLLERQWAERRAEQARQEAILRQGVEAALDEVTGLEDKGRWGEARAVLAQAANRLGEEGPDDLRARVGRARRDLDLVARLDDIRLHRATIVVEGHLDFAWAERRYAAAFADAGLAREGDKPAEVAGRVRASAVSGPLVAALDDWGYCTRDAGRCAWWLEVARRVDPDPWRDRARQLATLRDRDAVQQLLAGEGAADQPPELLVAISFRLREHVGSDAAGALLRAQARHADDFWLNSHLGFMLQKDGSTEASGYYRATLALRPDTAAIRNNLGSVLDKQGKRQEAEAEYRAAIRLDPKGAYPHYGLGYVLKDRGRYEEAKKEYQRAVDLGLQGAAERVRQCSRHIALAARLSAVLREDDRPAGFHELLEFAALCAQPSERRLRAAARFYAEALAAKPKLADDLKAAHRYNAARCAALAGCGQGKDADTLDDKEKTWLRRQALDWLRADLAAWTKRAQSHQPADRAVVRQALRHWKADADRAGVRGDALVRLPEAEWVPWMKLWTDVDALLAAVSAPERKP